MRRSLFDSALLGGRSICAAAIVFLNAQPSSASASGAPGPITKDPDVGRDEKPAKEAPELEIDEEDKPKFRLSMTNERTEFTCQTVPPAYPEACKARAKARELVVVEFDIDPNGAAVGADAVASTNDCFDAAAIEAVSRWRCAPTKDANGAPTWQRGRQTAISFLLSEN